MLCAALRLNTESKGICCGGNKEDLIKLAVILPALKDIIEHSPEVQKKARTYNNLFSFTAVSASGSKGFDHIPGGLSNLILHGKTYHRMLNGKPHIELKCKNLKTVVQIISAEHKTGPLRWILYDVINAELTAKQLELDHNHVQQLKTIFATTSPFGVISSDFLMSTLLKEISTLRMDPGIK